jgi:hypothetical protein
MDNQELLRHKAKHHGTKPNAPSIVRELSKDTKNTI